VFLSPPALSRLAAFSRPLTAHRTMRIASSARFPSAVALVLAVALLLLAACRSAPDRDGTTASPPVQFADIPVPDGMTLETLMNRSHSYEAGDFRFGDLYYYGNLPVADVASYMTQRMAVHGWTLAGEQRQERRVELLFERRPHRTTCTIWKDSSDVTRMHVQVRTDSPTENP
jgi:hypothetical protein